MVTYTWSCTSSAPSEACSWSGTAFGSSSSGAALPVLPCPDAVHTCPAHTPHIPKQEFCWIQWERRTKCMYISARKGFSRNSELQQESLHTNMWKVAIFHIAILTQDFPTIQRVVISRKKKRNAHLQNLRPYFLLTPNWPVDVNCNHDGVQSRVPVRMTRGPSFLYPKLWFCFINYL